MQRNQRNIMFGEADERVRNVTFERDRHLPDRSDTHNFPFELE
jgi:hypothetical protein